MYTPMDISRARRNDRLFRAITGMTVREFDTLLPIFEASLIAHAMNQPHRERGYGGGSKGNIGSVEKKLFFILFFMKCYPTADMAAFIFASSKSRTNHWSHFLLPILEKTLGRTLSLPARQIRTPEEFFQLFPGIKEILIDGVERPTIRRKNPKTQKKNYSGKKKRPTRKNTIIATPKKRILLISPTKHGKLHDKKQLDKQQLPANIPQEITIIQDTGFQGTQKYHPNTLMPKKKPKGGELTEDDKAMNRLISEARIPVEHTIGGMKRFGCASHINRAKNGLDDMFMYLSAGLWNFHLQIGG